MSETVERHRKAAQTATIRPSDPVLVGSLLSISKSTRALSALLLNEIGLHVGQEQLLIALDVTKPVSVCAVSVALNVRPSTVSKMVDRLVAKGLVERGPAKHDGRLTVLRLTAQGVSKRSEVHALWRRLEASLSPSDLAIDDSEFVDALQAIDLVLKRRLARLR